MHKEEEPSNLIKLTYIPPLPINKRQINGDNELDLTLSHNFLLESESEFLMLKAPPCLEGRGFHHNLTRLLWGDAIDRNAF